MTDLTIGGSNMTVELRDDTNTLYAKSNTGNKQWLAVITDTHPQYNYEREFVAYQKPKTSDRDSGTESVAEGTVLERVRYTHSGKNRSDTFYQLVDGEAHEIDEVDVEAALDGEIIPDIEPETHECDECGDEFDTEHGVAVHEGLVHSDDEETENEADAEAEPAADATDGSDQEVVADGGERAEPPQFADPGDRVRVDYDSAVDGRVSLHGTVDEVIHHDDQSDYLIKREHGRDLMFHSGVEMTGRWSTVYRLQPDGTKSWAGDDAYLTAESSGESAAEPELVADGGETEIRSSREVRNSDDAVRYVNNPDGTLYAYREDGEHVVASRGNEPSTRWTKRVPAERTAVVPTQQLWTIPDNWDKRVAIKRENTSYGIYHIPSEGVDVLISNPDNCHLVDKWFAIKRVGQLEVAYDDEIHWDNLERSIDAVRDIGEVDDAVVDALETFSERRSLFERKFAEVVNMHAEEALFRQRREPVSLQGWTTDPWGDVFKRDDIVEEVLSPVDEETLDGVLKELSHENVVPNYPEVRVDVAEDEGLPEEYYLRGLIQAGCTPPQAIDYLMTKIRGLSQTDWSEERGTSQPNISDNVSKAERALEA